jgi:hypothetical protein
MKWILLFCILLFAVSCREDVVDFQVSASNSDIYITSNPSGADIYLNAEKTGKQTPDSLTNLSPGLYPVKLKLVGYTEVRFNVYLSKGEKRYINYSFPSIY